MDDLLGLAVVWLLAAALVGWIATTKGKNGVTWFFLAILISPLIVGIIIAVIKPEPRTTESPASSVADELTKLATLRDRGTISVAEFDAQKARALSGWSPTATPVNVPQLSPKAGRSVGAAEVIVIVLIVAAIGGGALLLSRQNADRILADVASLIPTFRPTARTTTAPADGSMIVSLDEAVELVDGNGDDLGSIRVLDSDSPAALLGSGPTSGNRYVAALLQYDAVASWTYTLFDWAVHDSRQRQYEPLGYGPEPTLSGGTIAPGKNVEGWVAFEVPVGGDAWLDFQSSDDTIIFSVRLP